MPKVASGRLAILHLLLVLLESRQQRHWKSCEPRAHWDSGGTNRDGTRSWSLGEKPYDPWRLVQTSSPQRLRRSYSHAFARVTSRPRVESALRGRLCSLKG